MALFLIEGSIGNLSLEQVETALKDVAQAATAQQGELIEAQLGESLQWLFVIVEALHVDAAQQVVEQAGLEVSLAKAVHLVGQELDVVRSRRGKANYLVERNLPEGLTMAAYLTQKAQKSPLHNQVPEVNFERTYVCQDLSKALCLYDSPDEAAIKRVRAVMVVSIDALIPIRSVY